MRKNSKTGRQNRFTVDADGENRFTCKSIKIALAHAVELRRQGKRPIIWDTFNNQQCMEGDRR